jgi:hypothetical protein|tara:strand:+ start:87 stop:440 length:354 start_codon:yes stop_codon:yes gene_type:complete
MKAKPGPKGHKPTDDSREEVRRLAGFGIPGEDIALVVGVSRPTLIKHYRTELDDGVAKANAHVAGFLFNQARAGNVSAQIFWLKTRARWKEPPVEHTGEGGGPIGFAVEYVKAKKNA